MLTASLFPPIPSIPSIPYYSLLFPTYSPIPFPKVRNLLKLGTPLEAAISVGMSRKDLWRLARTLATQIGMTNQWLKKQGLISVKELWVNIHYPATAQ